MRKKKLLNFNMKIRMLLYIIRLQEVMKLNTHLKNQHIHTLAFVCLENECGGLPK